jgi:Transglycosylase SLT domain/D-alanyl-D-alanine carboxypeptidase
VRPAHVAPLVLVTGTEQAAGAAELTLALAAALSRPDAAALVCELGGSLPKPSLLASPAARDLAAALVGAEDPEPAVSRGHVVVTALPPEPVSLARLERLRAGCPGSVVARLPAGLWPEAIEAHQRVDACVLRADLPRDRSLAALWVRAVRERGFLARVVTRQLGRLAARRARAGIVPAGVEGTRLERLARGLGPATGQALPPILGAAFALVAATLVLAAMVGAATGKGRAQRAVDLAAVSAARSMRDDFGRLFTAPRLPDGRPNPMHLSKSVYLARARRAALEAAARNGVRGTTVRVGFPDARSIAPLMARVRIMAAVERNGGRGAPVSATAEAAPEPAAPAPPGRASGGGYDGPLAYRQGKPMRPDVAAAFDRMARAASRAGLSLVVSSGFRSDAEQSRLFAAHPDPRWVAPPGRSLHRCGTELDLGLPSAYAWLAANSRRFGFVRRYSWEAWHFGYERGPAPCARLGSAADGSALSPTTTSLPSFVPGRYRAAIARAASRWDVSGALLAAQLMAESNFNPFAVSPAGARGIAQFMPGTAARYGLRDPFDPEAAIDAQAHLMANLLREFRSAPLALAAYNAGPGALRRYGGIPPYAETRAYVARILGLMGGAGEAPPPALEVRLIA